ncbi:hypothetical protein ACFLZH_05410 [Patescibacteria group bacterium]
MKKLLALFIISLLVFSGCDWFNTAPADVDDGDNGTVVEKTDTTPTDEPEEVDEPEDTEPAEEEEAPAATDSGNESAEVLLAKCLAESGATLYAASWCGHCKDQKAAFGDALEFVNQVECAGDDDWTQECTDADVSAVPTWIFGDGTVKTGNTPLATLAEKSGCTYDI